MLHGTNGKRVHAAQEWMSTTLPETRDIAFMLFEEHKRKDVGRKAAGGSEAYSGARPDVTTRTIQSWVANQRTKSWQSWYMSEVLLGPWSDEKMWFSTVCVCVKVGTSSFHVRHTEV